MNTPKRVEVTKILGQFAYDCDPEDKYRIIVFQDETKDVRGTPLVEYVVESHSLRNCARVVNRYWRERGFVDVRTGQPIKGKTVPTLVKYMQLATKEI